MDLGPLLDPNLGAMAVLAFVVLRWFQRIEAGLAELTRAVGRQSDLLGRLGRAVGYLAVAGNTDDPHRRDALYDRALAVLEDDERSENRA